MMKIFSRLKKKYLIAFLFIFSIILYLNTLGNDFVFDDTPILQNPLATGLDLYKIFSTDYWYPTPNNSYRPITILSFSIDYFLSGNSFNTYVYHSTNLLLNALNVILIFFIVERIAKNTRVAFLSSLLFAAIPIHTESVAPVFGRPELLYTFFILSSFLLHLKNYKLGKLDSKFVYFLSLLLFALGLLSKETALILLPLIILYDITFKYSFNLKHWKKFFAYFYQSLKNNYLGYIDVAIFWFVLRIFLNIPSISATTSLLDNPLIYVGTTEKILTGIKIFGYYLQQLILPIKLSADYSYNQIPVSTSIFEPNVIVSLIALSLLTISLPIFFKKNKLIFFSLALLIFSIIAVSNIFFQIGTVMAERLMYFPSFGLVIIVSVILNKLLEKNSNSLKAFSIFLAVAIIFLFSLRTVIRNSDWRDAITLWNKTIETSPNDAKAYGNLGSAYLDKNDTDDAIDALKKAISIVVYYDPLNNLGVAYGMRGDYVNAINVLQQSLALAPGNLAVKNNLAIAYNLLGEQNLNAKNYTAAKSDFEQALFYNPNYTKALANLQNLK